ncbi:hypothetical protein NDU88_003515 [Pleurodeles waltl]|uniref:Uncharacterized protein n=1 Tax=Pleurodeles waltl TaxID=8319 RepID=A0AAV7UEA1_PLEWA|nr:hypothetical protein NDU88_003515 [Pleurodeles waltl]
MHPLKNGVSFCSLVGLAIRLLVGQRELTQLQRSTQRIPGLLWLASPAHPLKEERQQDSGSGPLSWDGERLWEECGLPARAQAAIRGEEIPVTPPRFCLQDQDAMLGEPIWGNKPQCIVQKKLQLPVGRDGPGAPLFEAYYLAAKFQRFPG